MDKSKQTPSDREGSEREPKPPAPPPKRESTWRPADDIFGEADHPVDADLDFEHGRYRKPPPKS